MPALGRLEWNLLSEAYEAGRRGGAITVRRVPHPCQVVAYLGNKRWRGARLVDALAVLYSMGLLQQAELNRFVLTRAGIAAARLRRAATDRAAPRPVAKRREHEPPPDPTPVTSPAS
jgi:hypothetical protein